MKTKTIRDTLEGKEFLIVYRKGADVSYCRIKNDFVEMVNVNDLGTDVRGKNITDIDLNLILEAKILPKGTYQKKFDKLSNFVKSDDNINQE